MQYHTTLYQNVHKEKNNIGRNSKEKKKEKKKEKRQKEEIKTY